MTAVPRVREVGEEIVAEIKSRNIPFVNNEFVHLDDFNDWSGQIYVGLKAEETGIGINKDIYQFDDNVKPLRDISSQLHAVCRKIEKEGKGSCRSQWNVPRPVYEKDSFTRKSTFLGYDNDFIMFDYDI